MGGMTPDTDTAAPVATDTTPTLTDANIVYILDQANAGDSARGRLAEQKGTRPEVKEFGKLMMADHHALRQQGQELAKKLGVTPEPPAGDQSEAQNKQILDSLQALAAGPAWDQAYIVYEVPYHVQLQQTAQKALGAAQNSELQELIKRAAPIVQVHLDRARQLQQKLGG